MKLLVKKVQIVLQSGNTLPDLWVQFSVRRSLIHLFRIHNGNLIVESKGGNTGQADYVYHKLSVPTDVDFKTLQTGIRGNLLIVSANKMKEQKSFR